MKNRLLIVFGVIGLLAFGPKAKAQGSTGSSISFGPDVVFPLNNSHHGGIESDGYYRDGGGFSAKFELPVLDEIKLTFSAGYQFYIPVDEVYINQVYYTCNGCTVPTQASVNNNAYQYIPLTIGFNYYFYKYLFVNIDAGDALKVGGRTLSSFIYGGGLAGDIPINKHNSIELSTGTQDGFKSTTYDYSITQIYLKAAYKYSF